MASFKLIAGLALAAAGVPGAAQDVPADILAERRLKACLMGGSAGAPKTSLVAAVVAVRALCRVQIERVRDDRLRAADARFGLPETPIPDSQRARIREARDAATRLLNDEVVVAISNFTGLTQ